MNGRNKLVEVCRKAVMLAQENPCGWSDSVLGVIADGIGVLVGEKTKHGISLIELSEYYHVTIRTIERWRIRFDDFPQPIDPYAKVLMFPTDEVVEWKQQHMDMF